VYVNVQKACTAKDSSESAPPTDAINTHQPRGDNATTFLVALASHRAAAAHQKKFRKPIRNVLVSNFQTKLQNQPTNRRRNNLGMTRISSRPAHGEIDGRELTME
jgi:hypothetical protein